MHSKPLLKALLKAITSARVSTTRLAGGQTGQLRSLPDDARCTKCQKKELKTPELAENRALAWAKQVCARNHVIAKPLAASVFSEVCSTHFKPEKKGPNEPL